jgi:hypothetical protein
VHEGGFTVETLGEGALRFRYPWGGSIPDAPPPRSPPRPPGDRCGLAERELAEALR